MQGFMVSSFSENVDLAKTFLLDYVNTEELQLALYEAGGRPPAMLSALGDDRRRPGDPGVRRRRPRAACRSRRSRRWPRCTRHWRDAYALIFSGSDPQQAFTDAADSIRTAISG